ncbi:Glucarate dehydratase [Cladorrhinum sp. PSN332]|nr:Glucarate dehydratase [Cladorrhinum sp. PSN332]
MKLDNLFVAAWLATAASALGPSNSAGKRLEGKAAPIPNFKWIDPFKTERRQKYNSACATQMLFEAQEFVLDDLADSPPTGLLQYRDALKNLFGMREYPGSWDGIDPHGYDRTILMMDYETVPLKVREWIEDEVRRNGPGNGLYGVYARPAPATRVLDTIRIPDAPVSDDWRSRDDRRVVLFAPGALHENLPLWLTQPTGCEEFFADLSKYGPQPVNGGVIGYPIHHTKPRRAQGSRDIEFTLKAEYLELKEGEVEEPIPEPVAEKAEPAEETEGAEEKSEKTEEKTGEAKKTEEKTEEVETKDEL